MAGQLSSAQRRFRRPLLQAKFITLSFALLFLYVYFSIYICVCPSHSLSSSDCSLLTDKTLALVPRQWSVSCWALTVGYAMPRTTSFPILLLNPTRSLSILILESVRCLLLFFGLLFLWIRWFMFICELNADYVHSVTGIDSMYFTFALYLGSCCSFKSLSVMSFIHCLGPFSIFGLYLLTFSFSFSALDLVHWLAFLMNGRAIWDEHVLIYQNFASFRATCFFCQFPFFGVFILTLIADKTEEKKVKVKSWNLGCSFGS